MFTVLRAHSFFLSPERKLKKQARKAERKAKKLAKSQEKDAGQSDHEAAVDDDGKSAKTKKEKKTDGKVEDPALEKKLLLVEKKRRRYLEKSKKLETEAQELLKQAEDATKIYQQMTKALEVKHPAPKTPLRMSRELTLLAENNRGR
jgi:hypothetical protein